MLICQLLGARAAHSSPDCARVPGLPGVRPIWDFQLYCVAFVFGWAFYCCVDGPGPEFNFLTTLKMSNLLVWSEGVKGAGADARHTAAGLCRQGGGATPCGGAGERTVSPGGIAASDRVSGPK